MSRYIDADALKAEGWWLSRNYYDHYMAYTESKDLDDVPTADVVKVVRCGECKWFEKWYKDLPPYDTGYYCTRPNQQSANLKPTDFCSYGERKNEVSE